jgi:ADP-ribose pyrophosphatase
MSQPNSIPRVERELLVKGVKYNYERLHFRGADGQPATREVVRHPGAVVILPILAGGDSGPQVILIRNWRISVEDWVYELPAGTLEPGEDPANTAGRELKEETGFTAARIDPLCRFYTSPGLTDELMWAYAATGLTQGSQELELDERVTVHPTPVARALAMISTGELADAKSILTLLLAKQRGLLGSSA